VSLAGFGEPVFCINEKLPAVQATGVEPGKTPALVASAASAGRLEQTIRTELALLQARYDHGALSPAVFPIVRSLEVELAWIAHRRSGRDE
jgi:hypothetical protein